eukprot:3553182-Rhodomonas_salina.1
MQLSQAYLELLESAGIDLISRGFGTARSGGARQRSGLSARSRLVYYGPTLFVIAISYTYFIGMHRASDINILPVFSSVGPARLRPRVYLHSYILRFSSQLEPTDMFLAAVVLNVGTATAAIGARGVEGEVCIVAKYNGRPPNRQGQIGGGAQAGSSSLQVASYALATRCPVLRCACCYQA